jgi:hypothetical protein
MVHEARMRILALVVLALFALALLAGFFVPVHTDEVGWKMVSARVFEEHGTQVTLFPQCSASFVRNVEASFYPGAVVFALLYSSLGLVGLRIMSILSAFVIFGLLGLVACRPIEARSTRVAVVAAVASFLGLGVMPLVFILVRNEQMMLLCLLAFCLLPIAAAKYDRSRIANILVPLSFIVTTSVFFFSHSKALFFLPFVLAAAVFTAPWNRSRWLLVLVPFIFFAAFQDYVRGVAWTSCDDAPFTHARLVDLTLSPGLLFTDPRRFLSLGFEDLVEMPTRIIEGIGFRADYGWLPSPDGKRMGGLLRIVDGAAHVPIRVAIVGVPIVIALRLRRWRELRGEASHRFILGSTLFIGVLANSFFYRQFAFYNCTLSVPALALSAVLVLVTEARQPLLPARVSQLGGPFLASLLVVGCASLIGLLVQLGPGLLANGSRRGAVAEEYPRSVPIFGYEDDKSKIRALGRECGITGDGATRLVVDDATYYAYEHLRQPINLLYITDAGYWGDDFQGEKVIDLLRRLRSSGVITRCMMIASAMKTRARVRDGYCCVGADTF